MGADNTYVWATLCGAHIPSAQYSLNHRRIKSSRDPVHGHVRSLPSVPSCDGNSSYYQILFIYINTFEPVRNLRRLELFTQFLKTCNVALEAQRGEVTFPVSHSWLVMSFYLNPGSLAAVSVLGRNAHQAAAHMCRAHCQDCGIHHTLTSEVGVHIQTPQDPHFAVWRALLGQINRFHPVSTVTCPLDHREGKC